MRRCPSKREMNLCKRSAPLGYAGAVDESEPVVRLVNALLLTQIREGATFLRVDADRGTAELAERIGEWRAEMSIPSAIVGKVNERLRTMGALPPERGSEMGRLTLMLSDTQTCFFEIIQTEQADVVIARRVDEAAFHGERGW